MQRENSNKLFIFRESRLILVTIKWSFTTKNISSSKIFYHLSLNLNIGLKIAIQFRINHFAWVSVRNVKYFTNLADKRKPQWSSLKTSTLNYLTGKILLEKKSILKDGNTSPLTCSDAILAIFSFMILNLFLSSVFSKVKDAMFAVFCPSLKSSRWILQKKKILNDQAIYIYIYIWCALLVILLFNNCHNF